MHCHLVSRSTSSLSLLSSVRPGQRYSSPLVLGIPTQGPRHASQVFCPWLLPTTLFLSQTYNPSHSRAWAGGSQVQDQPQNENVKRQLGIELSDKASIDVGVGGVLSPVEQGEEYLFGSPGGGSREPLGVGTEVLR